jgi:hypothetical protein
LFDNDLLQRWQEYAIRIFSVIGDVKIVKGQDRGQVTDYVTDTCQDKHQITAQVTDTRQDRHHVTAQVTETSLKLRARGQIYVKINIKLWG